MTGPCERLEWARQVLDGKQPLPEDVPAEERAELETNRRWSALHALLELGDEDDGKLARRFADDVSPEVRAEALAVGLRWPSEAIEWEVLAMLQAGEEHELVLMRLLEVLAEAPEFIAEHAAVVKRLSRHNSPAVRRAASEALARAETET